MRLVISDENHNENNEASSPSKRTKNVEDVSLPSVVLPRVPLSPRKDLNVSSPVRQFQDRSSTPDTLPKVSSQVARQPITRTRRNLNSSFANLTSDFHSSSLQKCVSVDEIGNKTPANNVVEGDTKTTNDVAKSTAASTTPSKLCRKVGRPSKANSVIEGDTKTTSDVAKSTAVSTTPSKPCRKVGRPSKAKSQSSAVTTTPSKTSEASSKHDSAVMRLVKDSGMLLFLLSHWWFSVY